MKFGVKVTGITPLTRKFTRLNGFFRYEISDISKKSAITGAELLVGMMPKQHMAMVDAVFVRKSSGNGWTIVSATPKGQAHGDLRPYQIYYNYGKRGWYKGPKKSGEYHYYEKTIDALGKIYPENVNNGVKKTIRR